MVSLSSVQRRFELPFEVIEGGAGTIFGVVAEAEQNSQPAYIFTPPRLVLRTKANGLMKPGFALRSPEGQIYLAGYNGPSETSGGVLWDSFRLFRTTGISTWARRSHALDPVTGLERDIGLSTIGSVYTVVEQIDRESYDRKISGTPFEQARFIAAAAIQADDVVDGRQVTRADVQLGLIVGTLT